MTDKPLAGKVAIVTGGGRCMDWDMTRAFAAVRAQGVCVTSGASLGEICEVANAIKDRG